MNCFSFLAASSEVSLSPSAKFFGSPLFLLLVMFLMMYFLIIRPQKKQKEALQKKISALKKGDEVITVGGVHGIIHHVKDASLTIKIADSVLVEFEKSAVQTVNNKK